LREATLPKAGALACLSATHALERVKAGDTGTIMLDKVLSGFALSGAVYKIDG
jgi:hypothetical protein